MGKLRLVKKFDSKQEIEKAFQDHAKCINARFKYLLDYIEKGELIVCSLALLKIQNENANSHEFNTELPYEGIAELFNNTNILYEEKVKLLCNYDRKCISIFEKNCYSTFCNIKYFNICKAKFLHLDGKEYCTTQEEQNTICTDKDISLPQCASICNAENLYDSSVESRDELYSLSTKAIEKATIPLFTEHCSFSTDQHNMLISGLADSVIHNLCIDC